MIADRFTRSPSKLNYVYVLTPAGVAHRLQLTRRFLLCKEQEFVSLKSEIERLRAALDASPVRASQPTDGAP